MPDSYIVRYGTMRSIAEFSFRGSEDLKRSDSVIVRSERGVEWGEVLCPASERTRVYLGNPPDAPGRILRVADPDARTQWDSVRLWERDVFHEARKIIQQHRLAMSLVDAEVLFGRERIVFYYLAAQRVDFRELVKALARAFQSRIEMRQIGVRDEARLLADFGDCGQPVCCGSYLREMPPVSMKMAKLQKATLDPNKISGRCGRLKCCLRYEYDTYEAYRRELPSAGTTIITRTGQGRVVAQELLSRKLLVDFESGRRTLIDASEVMTVVGARKISADPPQDQSSRTAQGRTSELPLTAEPVAGDDFGVLPTDEG